MLKHRIIPCVLLKDWQLVKSIQFGSFRTIGHPTSTVKIYNARNVDELIVLDIDASLNDEEINIEFIEDMADECFMPLTIGGGIRTLDDVSMILNAGADKISINSQAIKNPSFINEIATAYGSQCVVCSVDIKKVNGKYRVYSRKDGILNIDALELIKEYETQGAGEILLTSVDYEGMANGYDLEMIKYFSKEIDVPIIINGGMGKPSDGVKALENGADALAAAYIFHFSQFTPDDIKQELQKSDFAVRL